jgi:hypothetical protein
MLPYSHEGNVNASNEKMLVFWLSADVFQVTYAFWQDNRMW